MQVVMSNCDTENPVLPSCRASRLQPFTLCSTTAGSPGLDLSRCLVRRDRRCNKYLCWQLADLQPITSQTTKALPVSMCSAFNATLVNECEWLAGERTFERRRGGLPPQRKLTVTLSPRYLSFEGVRMAVHDMRRGISSSQLHQTWTCAWLAQERCSVKLVRDVCMASSDRSLLGNLD